MIDEMPTMVGSVFIVFLAVNHRWLNAYQFSKRLQLGMHSLCQQGREVPRLLFKRVYDT